MAQVTGSLESTEQGTKPIARQKPEPNLTVSPKALPGTAAGLALGRSLGKRTQHRPEKGLEVTSHQGHDCRGGRAEIECQDSKLTEQAPEMEEPHSLTCLAKGPLRSASQRNAARARQAGTGADQLAQVRRA